MKNTFKRYCLLGLAVCAFVIVGIVDMTLTANAVLPPRPTRTPVPAVKEKKKDVDPPPAGTLLLTTGERLDGMASVIQWPDAQGNWHDVDGWRADNIGSGKQIRWWVEEGHWGAEPYRWIIYQDSTDYIIAVSESFQLPDSGETLVVNVP